MAAPDDADSLKPEKGVQPSNSDEVRYWAECFQVSEDDCAILLPRLVRTRRRWRRGSPRLFEN